MNYLIGAFKSPCNIKITFSDSKTRKQVSIKKENGQTTMVPLFQSQETIAGEVSIEPFHGKKVEHIGVKVELLGQIELYFDRGNFYDFTSLVRELDVPGEIYERKAYPFEFSTVEMPYESYNGVNVRLRYILKVTISRNYVSNIVEYQEFCVRNYSAPPTINNSIKMEVGIEDCLHIEFEYNKSKYHLKDVIIGKIYFLLVRIKIKNMELEIRRRESTGSGPNTYVETETLAKFELMDGAPVRGESIPIRLFLSPCREQACAVTEDEQSRGRVRDEAFLASCYRTERNLRIALKPMYDVFFERLNAYPGGLKILAVLRADLLLVIEKEKLPSLRALDLYLKEKLITWLSPAALHLHQITWDDPASLLEKIVAYEAVHPIRSLQDLRRRLSTGRRCFGYFHSAIPGEPLIFIEVALLKEVAKAIQEVLWDDPPFLENEATCALFYSISSTQPGLSGINLGKFLIKRVIELVRRDMPNITVFATLSPIPGYVQWLLSKLASHLKLGEEETENETDSSEIDFSSTLKEHVLLPEEERMICESGKALADGNSGIEILYNLLSSTNSEWSKSDCLLSALKRPLMRLCIRYLLEKKKSGKTLDAVANFHLQNGARIERINWMADTSERGIKQSAGIMVNYVYSLEKIEENAMAYFSTGHINASSNIYQCFQQPMEE